MPLRPSLGLGLEREIEFGWENHLDGCLNSVGFGHEGPIWVWVCTRKKNRERERPR